MILKINPTFSEKIWGGKNLKKMGFKFEEDKIGEAWVISGYENSASKLENGEYLNQFYSSNKHLFNNYKTKEFPLLAKILDANDDLSVQVHPDNIIAKKLENYPFGKTESWYILKEPKNNEIIVGINSNSNDETRQMISDQNWNKLLRKEFIKKDDFLHIEAGTVHAILAGTIVYEIQQSSDITYRIYDYDRKDDKGNKRELNIDKSIESVKYNKSKTSYKKTPKVLEIENGKVHNFVNNEIYSFNKIEINGEGKISLDKDKYNFLMGTVIRGNISINNKKFENMESFIITSDELKEIIYGGQAEVLISNPN